MSCSCSSSSARRPSARRVRELLAGGDEGRRDRRRLLEGRGGIDRLLLVPEAHPDQVVRVGQVLVETDRLARRRERLIDLARLVPREGELERHARRQAVDGQTTFVGFCRSQIPAALIEDVAERLERAGGRRVEVGSAAEIAGRGFELVAALIRLAAPQVREHRIRAQGDGAAVRLDRAEGLVVRQGAARLGEQRPVVALPGGRLVGQRADDGSPRPGARPPRTCASSGLYPSRQAELPGRRGSNWV